MTDVLALPAGFTDLAAFSDWALRTEHERYDQRIASTMGELQAFYDALFPRLDDALAYLDQFPLDDMPEDATHLYWMCCALVTVSFPVEVWRQPRVPDSGASSFDAVLEPAIYVARVSTYVLVHGGGHGGWCYHAVARILRDAGDDVYAPTLTGLGDRSHLLSPTIDLDTHITDVVSLLHYEDLRDVILVGHSYGGMVITGVADRAADRVGDLVYLDAANPKNGQSLVDVAGPMILAARKFGRVVDGVELVLLPDADASSIRYYGVTDPETSAWMAERLTPHPWKCFEQPLRLTNEDALWAIPQSHIVCTSTLPTRDPELMDTARAAGRLWDIDTGHDLMITEPAAVADALFEIAAR